MSTESDIFSLVPEQYTIGLSATVGVTVVPGQVASAIRLISGGTCAIVSGASNVASSGFFIDSNILGIDIRGTFYLAAAGSTAIVHVLKGKTAGT